MAKKIASKRTVRSELNSFRDVPLSAKEIMEIEEIQKEPYWKRKPLKDLFCDTNNRMKSEVDEYFKKHKRPPDSIIGRASTKKKGPIFDPSSSIRAPKEQVTTEPVQTGFAKLSPAGEIRIKYKKLTVDIESGEIIFEV